MDENKISISIKQGGTDGTAPVVTGIAAAGWSAIRRHLWYIVRIYQ